MPNDKLTAELAAIREHHAQHVSVNYPAPGICVSRCRESWPCGPARVVAAVDAVLKLAADAVPVSRDYGGEPIWWTLTPDEVRSAVLAALTGKGEGGG